MKVIKEDKIGLSGDVVHNCKEFLDYVYSHKFSDKKSLQKELISAFHLEREVRSVYGNDSFSVRFSQNRVGDETFEGDVKAVTILAIKRIIDWNDKPFFNVVINPNNNKATVWMLNLSSIAFISGPNYSKNGTDKYPDYSHLTGSINGPDLIGGKVTSDNFEEKWVEQLNSNVDSNLERIFNSTVDRNNRLKSKRPKVYLDIDKLKENIIASKDYLDSSEYYRAIEYLEDGTKLVKSKL